MQEEVTTTYSVHAVVDQKAKCKVEFHEAVDRGLIDEETGQYVDNITDQRVSVPEAIARGTTNKTRQFQFS